MQTLRQQHEELNNKVNNSYRELVDKVETVSFFDEEKEDEISNLEYDDFSDCEYISFLNKHGDDIGAKVLKIDKKEGIYIAKDEYTDVRFWISLNDLSSLYDKITIVELLEATYELKK